MNIQDVYTGSFIAHKILIEESSLELCSAGTIDLACNFSDEMHDVYSKLLSARYGVEHHKIWIIPEQKIVRFKK